MATLAVQVLPLSLVAVPLLLVAAPVASFSFLSFSFDDSFVRRFSSSPSLSYFILTPYYITRFDLL